MWLELKVVVTLCSAGGKGPRADNKGKEVFEKHHLRSLGIPPPSAADPTPDPQVLVSWRVPHLGLGFEHLRMFGEGNLGSSSVIWGILKSKGLPFLVNDSLSRMGLRFAARWGAAGLSRDRTQEPRHLFILGL